MISPIHDIIAETRQGRLTIITDDEDRENEGDLFVPASYATPEAINFMTRYGRGLVCLTLEKARADCLQLPLAATRNQGRYQTAFTISIEARAGVTTGISAFDRAKTIQAAITGGAQDLTTPGHVFPIVACEGGVLARRGHTEASVDLARLAGVFPAGVICEIMNEDGTMARLPDLERFAAFHSLKIGTIADLVEYRQGLVVEQERQAV